MTAKDFIRTLVPTSVWGWLRVRRMRGATASFPARIVRHNYGGYELAIHLTDGLAQGWYDHDWPALTEIELLKRGKLKPGARVFNLGAHQGIVALMLARVVGLRGQVIALEASPHNAAIAQRNQHMNDAPQLTVIHAAVAQRSGVVQFGLGLNGQIDDGTGAWGRVRVQAWSIDELSERHGWPDVLFIDVEGYEYHALNGATKTLLRRPDCFVEVHVNSGLEKFGGAVEKIFEFFPPDAYERFVFAPSGTPQRYSADLDVLRDRFFLVALASGC